VIAPSATHASRAKSVSQRTASHAHGRSSLVGVWHEGEFRVYNTMS